VTDRSEDGEEGGGEGSRGGGACGRGAWGEGARGGVFVIGASSRLEASHSQKYSFGNFIIVLA
jgi:hypothetical protein